MVNAKDSHGNAYGILISPKGWRTLAGGNTPGNDRETLRPGRALESILRCPIRPISPIRPIPPHLGVSASQPLPTRSALIKNPNGVPSFSPGLAAQRPTPGKLPHKIQLANIREGRAKVRSKRQTLRPTPRKFKTPMRHPQFNNVFHPTNQSAHPKSTVDLGCEELIKVENGFRSPLFPGRHHPFPPTTTPAIQRNQDQNQNRRKPKNIFCFPFNSCKPF